MKRTAEKYRFVMAGAPLIFLAIFYFYPLTKICLLGFAPGGSWPPMTLGRFLEGPYFGILGFTFWQAVLSTVLTLAAAMPGAYVMSRFAFRGKGWVNILSTVPFVLPTVVTAAAFRALLGPRGLVNEGLMALLDLEAPPVRLDRTLWLFLLAHVFYNYALVLRIVGGFWARINPEVRAAARMLGASPWVTFRLVTLPLLAPAIGSAAMLVFIFCFTSFGVVLILGGPGYATLEVEIYRQAVQLFNLPVAAVLSLLQIGVNFALLWTYAWLGKRTAVSFYPDSESVARRRPRSAGEKLLVGANLGFMALLLGAPLAALVARSLVTETGLSPLYYLALFQQQARSVFSSPPAGAALNSAGFALAATCLALALGLLASVYLASPKGRLASVLDAVFMLPLATSAVTLGFGYIVALNRPPLNLRDSLALVPLAHALVAFPFVVRCLLPTLRSIPHQLREAAVVLGASPFQTWRRIDAPMAGRALLAGAVFAFSVSMGEFGASSFVTRPHTPTMPVAIFRFLGQPGDLNYGQAMAMSTLLMAVTAAGFVLLEKLRTGPLGEL